ncbi:TPA: type II toxin-antitoxin system VapC family toxin [Candidatus Woesearchaeota archaeon]|nr:type II toxin-antitoxin system VapC family toxin [Candidatus Woesearchaeota archaeon]
MGNKICLDTDFLVDFLRDKKEEVDFIKKNETDKELATTYT